MTCKDAVRSDILRSGLARRRDTGDYVVVGDCDLLAERADDLRFSCAHCLICAAEPRAAENRDRKISIRGREWRQEVRVGPLKVAHSLQRDRSRTHWRVPAIAAPGFVRQSTPFVRQPTPCVDYLTAPAAPRTRTKRWASSRMIRNALPERCPGLHRDDDRIRDGSLWGVGRDYGVSTPTHQLKKQPQFKKQILMNQTTCHPAKKEK